MPWKKKNGGITGDEKFTKDRERDEAANDELKVSS